MGDDLFNIDVVRDFMMSHGGKVRNHELVTHFKSFLSDPRNKGSNRQKFKTFVNTLATVKLDESGEKVLVLKKKYRDDAPTASSDFRPVEQHYKVEPPKAKLKDSFPLRKPSEDEPTSASHEESLLDSIQKELGKSSAKDQPEIPEPDYDDTVEEPAPDYGSDNTELKSQVAEPEPDYNLNAKDEADVFQDAVSEQQQQETQSHVKEESSSESVSEFHDAKDTVDAVSVKDRAAGFAGRSFEEEPKKDTEVAERPKEIGGLKKNEPEVKQEQVAEKEEGTESEKSGPDGVPVSIKDRVKHLNKISSETNLQQPSQAKKVQKRHDSDEGPVSIHLGPLEKEWLLASAKGDYHHMHKLLNKHPHLAKRKDFTNYTALHWAAKHGNAEIVKMLCGTQGVTVNCRSNGGYTPLHLAAMQGHEEVIEMLVHAYGADANLRDYSGKKPKQYLKNSASSRVQQLLQPRRLSHNIGTTFKRSGSYSSKINTAGHFGIKANAAMRTSWVDSRKSSSRSPSASPKGSPAVNRKGSSAADDFLLMPPPQGVPMRKKKSKQKSTIDSVRDIIRANSDPFLAKSYDSKTNSSNPEINRSGSDPMLSQSDPPIAQPVHQSTSYTSFV